MDRYVIGIAHRAFQFLIAIWIYWFQGGHNRIVMRPAADNIRILPLGQKQNTESFNVILRQRSFHLDLLTSSRQSCSDVITKGNYSTFKCTKGQT